MSVWLREKENIYIYQMEKCVHNNDVPALLCIEGWSAEIWPPTEAREETRMTFFITREMEWLGRYCVCACVFVRLVCFVSKAFYHQLAAWCWQCSAAEPQQSDLGPALTFSTWFINSWLAVLVTSALKRAAHPGCTSTWNVWFIFHEVIHKGWKCEQIQSTI